ncbi:DUF6794 domain-containing protein [Bradyrhizobium campsiandrae]
MTPCRSLAIGTILLVLLLGPVDTPRAAPASTELGPNNWPATVHETVQDLLPRIPLAERMRIKTTKKDQLISLYFGLGTLIRNRYGLWRGNDKLILSACGRPCHPDDASMKIIEALWQALQD